MAADPIIETCLFSLCDNNLLCVFLEGIMAMRYAQSPFVIFSIILVFYSIGIVAETIFLPAFKNIAYELNLNITYIESAYGYFFYTYGASMFFYGPISDFYGRRAALFLGKIFLFLGLFITYNASSYWTLALGIALLGSGFGAGGMLARAVARDLFFAEQLLNAMTKVNVIFGAVPVIAPIIGSYLVTYYSWRSIVILLLAASLVSSVYSFVRLPETSKYTKRKSLSKIMQSYCQFLSDKVFVLNLSIAMLSGSIIMLYQAKTAFIFQTYYELSALEHGLYGLSPVFGVAAASMSTAPLVRYFGGSRSLYYVNTYLVLLMVLFSVLSYYNIVPLWGFLLIVAQIYFCNTFTFSVVTSQAMSQCAQDIGSASALVGGIPNFGIGFFVSIIPLVTQDSFIDVSLSLLFLSTLLFFCNLRKIILEQSS